MKLLITGATGFIGSELCRLLLANNYEITALTRSPRKVRRMFSGKVDVCRDLKAVSDSDYFDGIINLAGAPIFGWFWTAKRKKKLRKSRVHTTRDLIRYIAKSEHRPQFLISGSAIGYYGNQGDREVDEATTGHDEFSHRLCRDWEREADTAEEYGVRICLLRTGVVIGRKGGFLKRMALPFKWGLGGRLGNGRQWMSWIHLDDHIMMIKMLMENDELSGVFNLTSPNPVTNREFTKVLGKLLHRPAFFHIPGWVLRILLGELSDLLVKGQKVLPAKLQKAGFQFRFASLEDALQDALSNKK